MNDIKKTIDLLSLGRPYAFKICLELVKMKSYSTLYNLKNLDISGEKLETLFDLCGFETPLQYLIETVEFLSAGYIDKSSMRDNLKSTNPVKFIHRLAKDNEDINSLYEKYTNQFYKNLRDAKDNLYKNKKK